MGVAGRFFAQLFGTTLCDFGAIMRWWLPACSGSSSAPGYLLPFLSPGIPIPGLSVCALPGCLHPSPTPPPSPFQGEQTGGGSWAVEIEMRSDACSGIWLEVADGAARMAAVLGCCRDIPSCFSCRPPLWGHGQVTMASLWAQETCSRCIRHLVWLRQATHSRVVIRSRLPTRPAP